MLALQAQALQEGLQSWRHPAVKQWWPTFLAGGPQVKLHLCPNAILTPFPRGMSDTVCALGHQNGGKGVWVSRHTVQSTAGRGGVTTKNQVNSSLTLQPPQFYMENKEPKASVWQQLHGQWSLNLGFGFLLQKYPAASPLYVVGGISPPASIALSIWSSHAVHTEATCGTCAVGQPPLWLLCISWAEN